jgi:hypothetical protein
MSRKFTKVNIVINVCISTPLIIDKCLNHIRRSDYVGMYIIIRDQLIDLRPHNLGRTKTLLGMECF